MSVSGGYRRYFVAVVGWLILVGAAQPPKANNSENASITASDIDNAAESIATSIRQSVISPDEDTGCADRQEKRDSDLCAQWKAADAARDAANYAFWSIIIGVIGTGFLLVTFRETRKVSRAQLRAYISIKPIGLKIFQTKSGKNLEASLAMRNGGQTPAYNVTWHGNIVALAKIQAPEFFDEDSESPLPLNDPRPTLINSSDKIEVEVESVFPISETDWGDILSGSKNIYLYGTGEYRDVFDRKHYTRFCYLAEPPIGQINDGGRLKQVPLVWQQAPFFNSAT